MTPHGKTVLQIIKELAGQSDRDKFTAKEITEAYIAKEPKLKARLKPVMTVSSYLTHLKRLGLADREASSDKNSAWWSITAKGEKALAQNS